MDMKEFDVLDASLTLRDLSREQKKAVARLLELQIEETAQVYTAKYAAQQKRASDRLLRGFLLGFIMGLLIAAAFALVLFGGG